MSNTAQTSELRGRKARMAAPTNGIERHLSPKVPIVTKTDLKGKITYANPAFVEISGFTQEELLGQPHNVVRHPDMPREAFQDLWDVVKTDQPWRGIVKNRCKDGGFYWVDAYVTPLTENGKKIGYMSVRSRPTEDQKRSAEALYADVRKGAVAFPSTQIKKGRPVLVDLAAACILPVAVAAASLMGGAAAAVVSLVLALILALGGAFWVSSRIQNNTVKMQSILEALSEGNFRFEVPSSPTAEFNRLFTGFKGMQVNLRAIIADVVSGSTRVKDDADNLRELAVGLMQRSEQQSDGINGVASALEELSVSVHEISEATNTSSSHANKALSVVDEGANAMSKSTEATDQVARVVQDARVNIEELNSAVVRISNVTRTITEIAEKTNLLALNAAIEAARAGESGRGFAVVADEVRKLAEMTRQSTTEIASTVQDVQNGTAKALKTMESAVEEVSHGTTLIAQANQSLGAIRQASQGVAQSASDISAMLEQQSQASLEVANSMERMSALTESNVAGIRELDGSAKTLAITSKELRNLVQHFEASL